MKREINCPPCDERAVADLRRAFGAALAPEGEHCKRVPGKLLRHCVCDSCGKRLWPGDSAVAMSLWADYGGVPYFAWEHEFLEGVGVI